MNNDYNNQQGFGGGLSYQGPGVPQQPMMNQGMDPNMAQQQVPQPHPTQRTKSAHMTLTHTLIRKRLTPVLIHLRVVLVMLTVRHTDELIYMVTLVLQHLSRC